MKIVWDEPKRLANIAKHGMDFADVVFFQWSTAVIDGTYENRMKAVGRFEDGFAVMVFAKLGTEAISIISFRRASVKERKVVR